MSNKKALEEGTDTKPGCTQWMLPFMKAMREELLTAHNFDLYADYEDTELRKENAIGQQFTWGTEKNKESITRQLKILDGRVKNSQVFGYFPDINLGDFCDIEAAAANFYKIKEAHFTTQKYYEAIMGCLETLRIKTVDIQMPTRTNAREEQMGKCLAKFVADSFNECLVHKRGTNCH